MHRLVKRTDNHLIIVAYELRSRLIVPPTPEDNPELLMRLKPHSFGHFLKKHGMVPPNMMGEEFDEENLLKEDLLERRDPKKDIMDHDDDVTCFEISVVNKRNMAVNIDCSVQNGEINFGKVRIFSEAGLEMAK